MPDDLRRRLRLLLRRAGLERVPDTVVIAALVGCALVVAWGAWRWWPRDDPSSFARSTSALAGTGASSAVADPGRTGAEESSRAASSSRVWVHVVGAVRRPGVYELAAGERVVAALEAAGGLLGNAAPQALNLARPIQDGEQISVPTKDEASRLPAATSQAGGASGSAPAGASAGPIDINSADATQLDTLPGIGPSTAAKIVADREANGRFASVDDLGRVAGIGPKKLDALRDLICAR